jgi:tRNA(fMet)-specific endonuclease VapC
MLVLDTDHISVLEQADSVARARLIHRLDQAGATAVVTTIVSYEEQSRGWLAYVARARSLPEQIDAYQRLARHLETYRRLVVLEYDHSAAEIFRRLRSGRIRIGTLDLRIAAITLANEATLLSRNRKDFEKIPDLNVENWLD